MLLALEMHLLNSTVRRNRAELEDLLTEDFFEFGSSGRIFDRESTVTALAAEPPLPQRNIANPRVVLLSAEAALITYLLSGATADGSGRTVYSLRSSLWIRSGDSWKLRFHQGTRAAPEPPSS